MNRNLDLGVAVVSASAAAHIHLVACALVARTDLDQVVFLTDSY